MYKFFFNIYVSRFLSFYGKTVTVTQFLPEYNIPYKILIQKNFYVFFSYTHSVS